jgi:hypothetical protein
MNDDNHEFTISVDHEGRTHSARWQVHPGPSGQQVITVVSNEYGTTSEGLGSRTARIAAGALLIRMIDSNRRVEEANAPTRKRKKAISRKDNPASVDAFVLAMHVFLEALDGRCHENTAEVQALKPLMPKLSRALLADVSRSRGHRGLQDIRPKEYLTFLLAGGAGELLVQDGRVAVRGMPSPFFFSDPTVLAQFVPSALRRIQDSNLALRRGRIDTQTVVLPDKPPALEKSKAPASAPANLPVLAGQTAQDAPAAEVSPRKIQNSSGDADEQFRAYSWTVVNSDIAEKELDLSAFIHGGTGVPKAVLHFFAYSDASPKKVPVDLFYATNRHYAYLERDPQGRVRLFWRDTLAGVVRDLFPDDYAAFLNAGQCSAKRILRLIRNPGTPNTYDVEFVAGGSECIENLGANAELAPDEQPTNADLDEIRKKSEALKTPEEVNALLRKIQDEFKDKEVKKRQRIANAIVRTPRIARLVKERDRHTCRICGIIGFKKRDGTLYAEVHHVDELARGGRDLPDNMICVCATCHRMIHYASEMPIVRKPV